MSMEPRSRRCMYAMPFAALTAIVALSASLPASGEPWLIGVVCPLTTSSRSFGIAHLQGVTLAVETHLKTHADLQLDIRIIDDQSNPDIAEKAIRNLYDQGAVAILGPCNSAVVEQIIENSDLRLPVVSSLATATNLTSEPRNFFFRANVSDSKRVSEILSAIFNGPIAADTRPKRLVALYEKSDAYGEGLLNDLKDWLRTNEKSFYESNQLIERSYPRDLEAERANQTIEELKGITSQDAILLLGLASDARELIRAIRTKDLSPDIYLVGPEPEFLRSLVLDGISLRGIRFVSVWDPKDPTLTTASSFTKPFANKFREKPTYAAALASDATHILLSALSKAIADPPHESLEVVREQVRNQLQKFVPSNEPLVLNSSHKFENGEYASLKFPGYQLTAEGDTVEWDAALPDLPNVGTNVVALVLPEAMVFLVVGFAGFLGSLIREVSREQIRTLLGLWHAIRQPISYLVDPIIAIVIFVILFVSALLFYPTIGSIGALGGVTLYLAASAAGFLAGFLGVRALHAVLRRLGVSGDLLDGADTAPHKNRAVS